MIQNYKTPSCFIKVLSTTLLLSGCSYLPFNETEVNQAPTRPKFESKYTDNNYQSAPKLWVWIAPEYRNTLSETNSEYIVIPIEE